MGIIFAITIWMAYLYWAYCLVKRAFGLDVILVVLLLITTVIMAAITEYIIYEKIPINCRKIIEVGGCNAYECGVKLNDGSYSSLPRPVVGMDFCDAELRLRRFRR